MNRPMTPANPTPEPMDQFDTSENDKKNQIKSGHFMISSLEDPRDKFDFKRGSDGIEIDDSLKRLFQCMSEAYKNGVTTPRWKKFNGMNIRLKDRIRLNNAIWRCWYIECLNKVLPRRKKLIQFLTPLDSDFADKEVTILEGNYWENKRQTIIQEYKNWRTNYWNADGSKKKHTKIQTKEKAEQKIDSINNSALIIEDGWFSDICDALHTNAIPMENMIDFSDFGFQTEPLLNSADYGFPPSYSYDLQGEQPCYDMSKNEQSGPQMQSLEPTAMSGVPDTLSKPYSEPLPRRVSHEEHITLVPSEMKNDVDHQMIPRSNDPIAPPEQRTRRTSVPEVRPIRAPEARNHYQRHEEQTMLISRSPSGPPATEVDIDEIGLENVDQSGQVTLPDGRKVILIQYLEDGSFVQIRGSTAETNVVFREKKIRSPPIHRIASRELPPEPQFERNPGPSSIDTRASRTRKRTRVASDSYSQSSVGHRSDYGQNMNYQEHRSGQATRPLPIPVSHPQDQAYITEIEQTSIPVAAVSYNSGPPERTTEHNRRQNMKKMFDQLENLLTERTDQSAPPSKMSKACILNKAREHIDKKSKERKRLQQEITLLRREVESLQTQINNSQDQLPAGGLPLSKARSERIQKDFLTYVAQRTEQNYKFYPFSMVLGSLFESYTRNVSASDTNRLHQTATQWLHEHCNLRNVRPAVSNALRSISTETCLLTDMDRFAEQCQNLARAQAYSNQLKYE